jgi:hypothetical protein
MITAATLKTQKSKELAQLAKQQGIPGWHSMRKEQLIKSLLKIARNQQRRKTSSPPTPTAATRPNRKAAVPDSSIALKLRRERQRQENLKNLAIASGMAQQTDAPSKDRIVTVVRDAFWLQAYWEITKSSVQRAKVALADHWHTAKPVLRVMTVTSDGNTNSVEDLVEEIAIHSGVNNWYFQNPSPGKTIRLAIGYVVDGGKFHLIAKSNQVSPSANPDEQPDENWTDITNDVERYYALSGGFAEQTVKAELQNVLEEKSQQSVYAPAFERLGSAINIGNETFAFQVDAHLVVHGNAAPGSSVSVSGRPVTLQKDGTFAVRMDLPERRQILPIVAANRNGTQQRTTVLAIERNTKVMDPIATDAT